MQLGVLLLALMQAGSVLGRVSTVQQPHLLVLLPSLLLVVALLLGRMGPLAALATVAAVTVTRQALMLTGGTGYFGVSFSARMVEIQGSSGLSFWLSASVWQFWAIAAGSAVLALNRRIRGPLPRRSGWWLTVPLLEAGYSSYSRSLMTVLPLPRPEHLATPASVDVLSVLPTVAAVVLLLLALRATVAIGDARWAVAAGVYLVPTGIYAASLVSAAEIATGVYVPPPPRCGARNLHTPVLRVRRVGRCRAPVRNPGAQSSTSWVPPLLRSPCEPMLWSVPDDSGTQVRLPASPTEIVGWQAGPPRRGLRRNAIRRNRRAPLSQQRRPVRGGPVPRHR